MGNTRNLGKPHKSIDNLFSIIYAIAFAPFILLLLYYFLDALLFEITNQSVLQLLNFPCEYPNDPPCREMNEKLFYVLGVLGGLSLFLLLSGEWGRLWLHRLIKSLDWITKKL